MRQQGALGTGDLDADTATWGWGCKVLAHLGEPVDPPRIAPAARAPQMWEAVGQDRDDLLIQPLPEYEFDQRIAW